MFRTSGVQSAKFIKKKRRKMMLQAGLSLLIVLLFLFCSVKLFTIDKLALHEVVIKGNTTLANDEVKSVAEEYLTGEYLFFYPKRTLLLYPKKKIEEALRSTFKRIKNVSLDTDAGGNLTISIEERKPYALWCGNEFTLNVDKCFYLDSNAYVFEKAPNFSEDVYMNFFGELHQGFASSTVESAALSENESTSTDEISTDESTNEYVGNYYITHDMFENIQSFINEAKKTGIEPIGFTVKDNAHEFELTIRNSTATSTAEQTIGKVLFNTEQPFEKTLQNLNAFVAEYKERNKGHVPEIEYVDLRYGNNIVYKFR